MGGGSASTALAHNRRADYDDTRRILGEAIEMLGRLGPDDQVIAALIAQLTRDREALAHALQPLELKRRHFANYTISESRSISGRAQRRPRAS